MQALILSSGGSAEPLIYCIKNLKSDFIYFLCSKDSQDTAYEVVDKCGLENGEFKFKIVENHESLEDSFAKSREIIQELQKKYDEIHVDFTGGTKTLVSGLVLAAIGEKCTYSYVGTDRLDGRDKDGLGIVQNGFESIINQRDPYDVFAVMEFMRGLDFFNKYQFIASKLNFKQAYEKLESTQLKELCEIYIELVNAYDLWDKFNNTYDNQSLISILQNILAKINSSNNLKNHLDENYPKFIPKLKDNTEFLKHKISEDGVFKLRNVKYYLPDLLNNAQRRIEEGKYDDAVARLYRAIELIAQVSLSDEKVIDEHTLNSKNKFYINKNDLISKYNSDVDYLVGDWYEYLNSNRLFGVGLKKSYQLLKALGSSYADEYLNDNEIQENLKSRNKSILAHGLKPIERKQAEELYQQVFKYAQGAFPDIEKYMEMSKFPKFE